MGVRHIKLGNFTRFLLDSFFFFFELLSLGSAILEPNLNLPRGHIELVGQLLS